MKNLLSTHHLTIKIADKIICRELNLEINAGDVWGILGANGSGKTTLLHTFAGLHSAVEGDIFLQRKKLSSLSAKQIAKQCGILLQDSQDVFPQTVLEFCLSGRYPHLNYFAWESHEDNQIARAALTSMNLENKLTQKIQTLSGGERRRLAIATLLTQTPELFLLDEPLNHLDLPHQVRVLNHFQFLAEQHQKAIVMSLHDVNIAQQFCNKILMLFPNGDVLHGKPEEMLTTNHLTCLYQHPLRAVKIDKKQLWIPELETHL